MPDQPSKESLERSGVFLNARLGNRTPMHEWKHALALEFDAIAKENSAKIMKLEENFASAIETVEILSDNDLVRSIAQGQKDIAEGRTIPFEQIDVVMELRQHNAALVEALTEIRRHIAAHVASRGTPNSPWLMKYIDEALAYAPAEDAEHAKQQERK